MKICRQQDTVFRYMYAGAAFADANEYREVQLNFQVEVDLFVCLCDRLLHTLCMVGNISCTETGC